MTALSPSALNTSSIQALLTTHRFGRVLHLLEETGSTNAVALALAQGGAEDGTVVAAEKQTAGRGRLGRRWVSPEGENLYCSIILRTIPASPRGLSWVPLVAAVAAARAVDAIALLSVQLKWPNDILLGERKVGGILCESSGLATSGRALDGIVSVGIGINVNTQRSAFPGEIRETATSLSIEAGRSIDRTALLAFLLNALEARYDRLRAEGAGAVEEEYRRLCGTVGRRVRVELAGGRQVVGRAEAILDDGSLRVACEAPPTSVMDLHAADVVHLH